MKGFFKRVMPFVMMGISLVAFSFGLLLLAYLLVFGAAVGLVLYLVVFIKENIFQKKPVTTRSSGRVIDSKDWEKMP